VQASTAANSAATTTAPNPSNTPLTSSTNARGDGSLINRSAPDRKTIHSTYPSRQHQTSSTSTHADYRASTRNPNNNNNNTMGLSDGNTRHQQQAGVASSMIAGSGTGAQSFLSKISSKFARR